MTDAAARFGDFTKDERDCLHWAITAGAKRILDDAGADRLPHDQLDGAAGMFLHLSNLARQLDLVAGKPVENLDSAVLVAQLIASGEAPEVANAGLDDDVVEVKATPADERPPTPRSWNEQPKLTDLIGHVVDDVLVSPGEADLFLHLTDGKVFTLQTEGDCCSTSWWADIVGVRQLLGSRITAAEDIDMPDIDPGDNRSRQEVDVVYGVKITTERGACDLIFRNSSNGYYGGWYGCSVGRTPAEGSVSITEDWSA